MYKLNLKGRLGIATVFVTLPVGRQGTQQFESRLHRFNRPIPWLSRKLIQKSCLLDNPAMWKKVG